VTEKDEMKLPSLQWYPSDWLRDPAVRALTLEARAVWFDLLMHMHACEPRGKLVLNGAAIPDDALANMLGLDKQILTTHLKQILTLGVAGIEPSTGIIFSRRMMRDEELRQIRAKAGKLGGNPRLLNQNPTTHLNQNPTTGVKQTPTPSSSSSSSVSKKKETPTPLATPTANASTPIGLWTEKLRDRHPTPCEPRYIHQFCFDNWHRLGEDVDKYEFFMAAVFDGLEAHCGYWADDGNRFAMALDKWLSGGGWKKAPPERKTAISERDARIKRQEEIDASWEVTS
jgi:hypothetical protein